jgi:Ca2+-transporting ATPase
VSREEALHLLETQPEGLGDEEAQRRAVVHGPNTLDAKERRKWYGLLARQLADVLVLILLVAAALSVAIGELTDALTIIAIVVLNALLGFVQEWKAERALGALKKLLSQRCRVRRRGKECVVDASTLVPGDVVILSVGDRVAADTRLCEAVNLQTDESALTGESVSVVKDAGKVAEEAPLSERHSMAWMGTVVTNGHATGVVVSTGMNTEFGRIARLTETIDDERTPLQRKLFVLGRQLGVFAIVVSTAVVVIGLLTGRPPVSMFFTGVSLAVALVPEGLPVVVTITLALGIQAMAGRRALLRRLQAAEALGAATTICTDKTGTVTQNEMTL